MIVPTDERNVRRVFLLSPVRNISDSISVFQHPLSCFSTREEEGIKWWSEPTSLCAAFPCEQDQETHFLCPGSAGPCAYCHSTVWQYAKSLLTTPVLTPSQSTVHSDHGSFFHVISPNSSLIYLKRLGGPFLAYNNEDVSKKHYQSHSRFNLMQEWCCHFYDICLHLTFLSLDFVLWSFVRWL